MLLAIRRLFYNTIINLNNYPVFYHGKHYFLVGFGVFAAVGTFLGMGVFIAFTHSKGISFNYPLGGWLAIVVFLMMIFSKLLHPFVVGKDFFKTPIKYIKQTAFYNQGGQLGVLVAMLIISYYEHANLLILLDGICYAFALALVMGRLGCYNYGCCYGKVTNSRFAVTYTNPQSKVLRFQPELYNVPLIPTQLISSAFDLLLFIGLTVLYFLGPKDGIIAITFIAVYNLFRIYTHRLRANDTQASKNDDCKIFLLLSTLFTGMGAISIIAAVLFYDYLPQTDIQIPLSLSLYLQEVFLNLNNFIPMLIVSMIILVVYGCHHLKLGEHF